MDGRVSRSEDSLKDSRIIRIHNSSYPELTIPGKQFYPDRALLLPGIAFVSSGEEVSDYHDYLRGCGIGASEVCQIADPDIYSGILGDQSAREYICRLVGEGYKIEFFNSTSREENFVREMGFDWKKNTISAPAEISMQADNKAWLRSFAKEIQCEQVFPRHAFCRNKAEVLRELSFISETNPKPDFVVLKRTNLASGLGLIKLRTDMAELLRAQLTDYFNKNGEKSELILEAGYLHAPLSVLWEIKERDISVAAFTRQILDEKFVHQGNIIATHNLPGVSEVDRIKMAAKTSPFVLAMQKKGYRGLCGFDLMKTRSGDIFVLECNARVTATAYIVGLLRQITVEHSSRPCALHAQNLYPKNAGSFKELSTKLGSLIFKGVAGILPFNVRCLTLPEPKCGLICIADTAENAAELYGYAANRTS